MLSQNPGCSVSKYNLSTRPLISLLHLDSQLSYHTPSNLFTVRRSSRQPCDKTSPSAVQALDDIQKSPTLQKEDIPSYLVFWKDVRRHKSTNLATRNYYLRQLVRLKTINHADASSFLEFFQLDFVKY